MRITHSVPSNGPARTVAIAVLLGLATAGIAPGSYAAPYCDPRADLNCYKRWCASQGGTFTTSSEYGGLGCKPPSGGGASGAPGAGAGGSVEEMMMGLTAQMMTNFLEGMHQQRQQQEQQREAQQREQTAEYQRQWDEQQRLRMQKEAEQSQRLEEARRRVLDTTGESGLGMRDLSANPALEDRVEETRGTFGTKERRPRDGDLASATAPLKPRAIGRMRALGAGERMDCSAALLRRSNELAHAGNFSEAAYLSNEAASIMQGATPGVECPRRAAGEAPRDVKGVQAANTTAVSEMLQKRTLAYSKLFSRANQQAADYRSAESSVRDAETELKQAQQYKEQASSQVRELETVQTRQPNKVDPSAMAEAMAALRQAEGAERQLAQVVVTRKDALDGLKQQIDKTKTIARDLDKKPEALDDILKDLNGGAGKTP